MSTTAQQEVNTSANVTTGNFVWHELRTTDAKGAEDFYTHVVGWKAKSSGDPGGIPYGFSQRAASTPPECLSSISRCWTPE